MYWIYGITRLDIWYYQTGYMVLPEIRHNSLIVSQRTCSLAGYERHNNPIVSQKEPAIGKITHQHHHQGLLSPLRYWRQEPPLQNVSMKYQANVLARILYAHLHHKVHDVIVKLKVN